MDWKAVFRTNCPTLTSPWSANRKAEKLFDVESQQQCLFSSVAWCWVELSHTEHHWVPVVLRKQCQEGRGLKDIMSLKTWFPSLGGSMHTAWESWVWPLPPLPMHWGWYPAQFWSTVPTCSLSSAWWPPEPDTAVAKSWAELSFSASLPHTQRTWSQMKVLASGCPPPGTWADRSDMSFVMWGDKALPGMLEKQIYRRCATEGDNQEEELWNSCLIPLQFTEPENSSVHLDKRRKTQARR